MKASSRTIVVMLRQPQRNNPNEMRSDPFWEVGSFGCTGCHRTNLLNPKRIAELNGARLAFMQGGHKGIKLVFLTPPVEVVRHDVGCELRWAPTEMPLKYDFAPTVISNDRHSGMDRFFRAVSAVARRTWVTKFASKFRSRRKPLPPELAKDLDKNYRKSRGEPNAIARNYTDAMPYAPRKPDGSRKKLIKRSLRICSDYLSDV